MYYTVEQSVDHSWTPSSLLAHALFHHSSMVWSTVFDLYMYSLTSYSYMYSNFFPNSTHFQAVNLCCLLLLYLLSDHTRPGLHGGLSINWAHTESLLWQCMRSSWVPSAETNKVEVKMDRDWPTFMLNFGTESESCWQVG